MIDLSKVIYYSGVNAFKNIGVYDTSISMSGTIAPGATQVFAQLISLPENQNFAYAIAEYSEFIKGGTATWQVIPTFDAKITTTPTGNLSMAIFFVINGSTVAFKTAVFNPYGGTETITATTLNIRYVTYTVDN